MSTTAYIGKRPQERGTTDRRPNQWTNNPKQELWATYYMDVTNIDTFGNAYASAIKAGYSDNYARQIASPAINNLWIKEYKRTAILSSEHIVQGVQRIAVSGMKDSDRLRAYELLARLQGLLVDKSITATVNIEDVIGKLK